MRNITNDRELRSALNRLSIEDQRAIGLLFVASIKLPEMDSGLKQALEMALDSDGDGHEREMAYKAAKSVATRTYTACGRDTDWEIQAEHFIAAACSAALIPERQLAGVNPAWKAAIQSRMANNCLMMRDESDELRNEAQKQYEICEEFLLARS